MSENKQRKKRRPKGDGSIQHLTNNKYKIQITIGYNAEGRQIRKSATSNTKREAVALLNSFKAELQNNTLVSPSNCKFTDFAYRWLSFKKIQTKKTSYTIYSDACRLHILPVIGNIGIQKLTTAIINDYTAQKINAGLAVSTVIQHRAIIRAILDLACKEGVTQKNAVDGSNPISQRKTETPTLTPQQIRHLLQIARDIQFRSGNHFKNIYHIVLLALATGARRGELLALKWENVDFENNKITIKEHLIELSGGLYIDSTKTESSRRVISVKPEILKLIRDELSPAESEFVFHTKSGKPIAPSSIGKAYRRLLAEANIEGVRFHDLRHTHATYLVADGVNVKMVSKRIGHSDVKTTLRLYTHALPEQDTEAAEKIGERLL